MNNEPCVRLGMRISPKMREKPAESRNSSPPKVMLLTARTSQKFIVAAVPALGPVEKLRAPVGAPASCHASRLERREVARIDGLFEKLLLVIRPELADVGIGLDRFVDELAAGLLTFADVEVADRVPQVIELDRTSRCVREGYRPQHFHEFGFIIALAAGFLQCLVDHHTVDVETGCIKAGIEIEVLLHPGDEPFIGLRLSVEGVWAATDKPNGLIPIAAQKCVVTASLARDDGEFESCAGILLHKLQRIAAGETLAHAVAIGNLCEVGRIVGCGEWRPQLLEDFAAVVFEGLLETAHLLVAESEIFRDSDHALEIHLFGSVIRHGMHCLR